MTETRGRRAFLVESEYLLERPEDTPRPAVLLILHGYGDTAERLAARLGPLDLPGVAVLVAGGPIPVEVREGDTRRIGQAWYCYDGDQERFRDALEEVEAYLDALLDDLRKKADLDTDRLVVAGYSMGAYVAGFFGLRRKIRPLGVGLLAGRLKHEFLESELGRAAGLPVFLGYGNNDERLPHEALAEGRRRLEAAGAEVSVFTHDGGHGLTAELAQGFHRWAADVLRR
jgi:phospholipase/carboxylesterase